MSSPTPNPRARCHVCGEPTSYRCKHCKQARYCSQEHSRSDWPRHRIYCGKPPTTTVYEMVSTPDSWVSVVGIFFPVREARPQLITVNCIPSGDSSEPCPAPLVQPWFPNGRNSSLTLTQGLNREPLRFPFQIWYDRQALSNNSPINIAIDHLVTGENSRAWSGEVVVLKHSGPRRLGYSDASFDDLPALSDYFRGL